MGGVGERGRQRVWVRSGTGGEGGGFWGSRDNSTAVSLIASTDHVRPELLHTHQHDDVELAGKDLSGTIITVQAIPVTVGGVTATVAMPVLVVDQAIRIVHGVAVATRFLKTQQRLI